MPVTYFIAFFKNEYNFTMGTRSDLLHVKITIGKSEGLVLPESVSVILTGFLML